MYFKIDRLALALETAAQEYVDEKNKSIFNLFGKKSMSDEGYRRAKGLLENIKYLSQQLKQYSSDPEIKQGIELKILALTTALFDTTSTKLRDNFLENVYTDTGTKEYKPYECYIINDENKQRLATDLRSVHPATHANLMLRLLSVELQALGKSENFDNEKFNGYVKNFETVMKQGVLHVQTDAGMELSSHLPPPGQTSSHS